ncbi:rhomboid family intramembrane serine protease [Flavobacterium sp. LC2016-01]|uniref:rhomboid family intramembrane serine protease n=1 Tax=Flavobacterium sp. LC2016-01 TaxID=2675876 RepID=UPI0012BADDFE|nr:rhomboid family intramembrane serine protease [Flavobacterium sp. LC2016-01]MTH17181.1 rhomboid family intramembrane serine protease [Flavobacterium sp. LC2016-01]
MKDLAEKFKLIYIPFLVITISFIIGYTFLHWLLFIELDLFSIKEMFLKFWLPFGLPYIPIYFFLRPRLKHLKFKDDNKSFGVQFFAVVIIAIPTMIAQEYLVTSTGKLTTIKTIAEIQKHEKTKYYTLQKFYIDKENIGVLNTSEVSGKNNEHFDMLIYVAMPILEKSRDTSKYECKYWLGKKYTSQISNHFSNTEKQIKFKEFAQTTEQEFKHTDFNQFTYLELVGNTDDHDNFNDAIEENTQYDFNKPILLEAHNDPFENRNGKKMAWFFGTLGGGLLVWLLILMFTKLQPAKYRKSKIEGISKISNLKESFGFLIPKEGFYITPILININLIIFIIMVFSGFGFFSFKGKYLLEWGANYRPLVTNGQGWRLLTSLFLHGGLIHLFNNMIGLWFIGILLEKYIGKTKYLLTYLGTGIIASIASIWWNEATVSIGASGAIFGLFGLFLALLVFKVFPNDTNKVYLNMILGYVGINLIMGLLIPGIDNAAHIGGLISGFTIGFLLSDSVKENYLNNNFN